MNIPSPRASENDGQKLTAPDPTRKAVVKRPLAECILVVLLLTEMLPEDSRSRSAG
jgi:hypothetical protein